MCEQRDDSFDQVADLLEDHQRAERAELLTLRARVVVLGKALRDVLGHMQPAEDESCTWLDGPDGKLTMGSGSLARAILAAYAALGETRRQRRASDANCQGE